MCHAANEKGESEKDEKIELENQESFRTLG